MKATKKGLVFVLSAPAGTGKTTLMRMLQEEFPRVVGSISCTTRHARPKEINGKDYHFVSPDDFNKRLAAGEFLEHATVFDHQYGTLRKTVEDLQKKGKHVFLVIDTQGAMQIKGKIPAIFIFVAPPTLEELKNRLGKRQTETLEVMQKRIAWAKHEMEMTSHYDYLIVNENLSTAYQVLRSIVIAEEHRTSKD